MEEQKFNYLLNDQQRMRSIDEFAYLSNVHRDTVRMWVEVGIIKPIKTGKNYMFSQEEISRFQRDYLGLDVSNKVKALESYKLVNEAYL